MSNKAKFLLLAGVLCAPVAAFSQSVNILLPERTRLLQDQQVDLFIEVRGTATPTGLRVTANGTDITSSFQGPTAVDLDCNGTQDAVYRAPLYRFQQIGGVRLTAAVGTNQSVKDLYVQRFDINQQRRNVILYIGDAMGATYRDAARIVARSTETVPGVSGFREGYFDNLLEMDKMPVSGMAMTYAADRLVPDSANTASTWSTGNKIIYNAMGVFPDGTDCVWRAGGRTSATLAAAVDNPRIETLWEYMKRRFQYRTGIVTTADVTDATPAGEGTHIGHRDYRAAISLQYLANPMLSNQPVYDVILGGGLEQFEAVNRADQRNLLGEFQTAGYTITGNATDLRAVPRTAGRLLGLFRRGTNTALASSGIRASVDGNMDVAYDKLRLTRPGSEPQVNFNGFEDQPFLDAMTQKAIEVLSGPNGTQPFILMVEGASIDKQSHPNHAAGVIWDTIELDKAVGVGRTFARARAAQDTLLVVSADHDQSMHIIGVTDMSDEDLFNRAENAALTLNSAVGAQNMRIYRDSNTNVRAAYNYTASGGDPNTTGREGPPAFTYGNIADTDGFPDYLDANADGYPENRQAGDRGRKRISVGFRTGNHTGSAVPVTAEGPGAFLFTGYYDQGDIMLKMAGALGSNTSDADALMQRMLRSTDVLPTIGK